MCMYGSVLLVQERARMYVCGCNVCTCACVQSFATLNQIKSRYSGDYDASVIAKPKSLWVHLNAISCIKKQRRGAKMQ